MLQSINNFIPSLMLVVGICNLCMNAGILGEAEKIRIIYLNDRTMIVEQVQRIGQSIEKLEKIERGKNTHY